MGHIAALQLLRKVAADFPVVLASCGVTAQVSCKSHANPASICYT
jgi:hypothetical protein